MSTDVKELWFEKSADGRWCIVVPCDTPVGAVFDVAVRRGGVRHVEVGSFGSLVQRDGERMVQAFPAERRRRSVSRSARSYRGSGHTYGRCEDAPCCGCCS